MIGLRAPTGSRRIGRGPRLQDFRHSFATRRLIEWYRAGFDVERGFSRLRSERREETAFARGDFEAEPVLATVIVEINVTSGEIRDLDRSDDRLVRDVIEAFELQFHLDLGVRRRAKKKKSGEMNPEFHRRVG